MESAGQEYRSTLTAFCFIIKMISRVLALGVIASQSGPLACKKSRVAQASVWLHGLERLHVRGHFVNIPHALVAASLAAAGIAFIPAGGSMNRSAQVLLQSAKYPAVTACRRLIHPRLRWA